MHDMAPFVVVTDAQRSTESRIPLQKVSVAKESGALRPSREKAAKPLLHRLFKVLASVNGEENATVNQRITRAEITFIYDVIAGNNLATWAPLFCRAGVTARAGITTLHFYYRPRRMAHYKQAVLNLMRGRRAR
ncbi:hypothetical protein [Candidatus Pantoea persica]|uniref:hypothetical protein n=1 Tax=Candidatus Pantoea persica TaxID=2518128 RepID=UPI00215DA2F2|nr:hypothetical protein [Candidatus Pantoea persica]